MKIARCIDDDENMFWLAMRGCVALCGYFSVAHKRQQDSICCIFLVARAETGLMHDIGKYKLIAYIRRQKKNFRYKNWLHHTHS